MLTHPGIAHTKNEVREPKTTHQFPHFAKFSKYLPPINLDFPVALLIGTDCGGAMRITHHGDTFPYTHDTALGRALVGLVSPLPHEKSKLTTSRSACAALEPGIESPLAFCHGEHVTKVKNYVEIDVLVREQGE